MCNADERGVTAEDGQKDRVAGHPLGHEPLRDGIPIVHKDQALARGKGVGEIEILLLIRQGFEVDRQGQADGDADDDRQQDHGDEPWPEGRVVVVIGSKQGTRII